MNAKKRELYYREAYEHLKKEYDAGLNIVIVSEGDILFYSTFGYLWKLIRADGLNCLLIPGIPAFIAAGSQGKIPLAEGDNNLKVISCSGSFDKIKGEIEKHCTLVIMKLSKLDNWDTFFRKPGYEFLYAERIGTENQFVTNNASDLIGRRIPYFSLLIIYG